MFNSCGSIQIFGYITRFFNEFGWLYPVIFPKPEKTGNRSESYCKTGFQVLALHQN